MSCPARISFAAASASESFEISLPPLIAESGRPPPLPPVTCATAPTSLPACAPALTASGPAAAIKFSFCPSQIARTITREASLSRSLSQRALAASTPVAPRSAVTILTAPTASAPARISSSFPPAIWRSRIRF